MTVLCFTAKLMLECTGSCCQVPVGIEVDCSVVIMRLSSSLVDPGREFPNLITCVRN